MSDAYKCDKCKVYVDSADELAFGDGSHSGSANRQKHLCEDCMAEFKEWLGVTLKH